MKLAVVALTALAFAGGCESMSDATAAVRDRITARDSGRTKTFPAEQRAVYNAVQIAAAQMGYRFVRGGPAQGEFEAINSVGAGERSGTARQLAMKVRLERALDGGTELTIKITEILEADSSNRAGMATQTPLRDTPQYEVFLHRVEQALQPVPAAAK